MPVPYVWPLCGYSHIFHIVSTSYKVHNYAVCPLFSLLPFSTKCCICSVTKSTKRALLSAPEYSSSQLSSILACFYLYSVVVECTAFFCVLSLFSRPQKLFKVVLSIEFRNVIKLHTDGLQRV